MVPSSWIHTTFEKHIDCLTGYAFKSSNYSDSSSDIKLLRGDNIEPGSLRWRDAKYWSINQLDGLERYQLNKGDFVIALDRTWISSGLKVAEVRSEDLPCLLVQRVIRVRAKKTLEQGLLRQYFSGHKFEQYVKSVQTATAVPHISPNDIKEFPLLLPPLAEQQKIAQILSTWDQAISVTEKLLKNSQQQKKALMQQLLTGKKRLLDDHGVRFSATWLSKSLKDISKVSIGLVTTMTEHYVESGIHLIRNSDIKENRITKEKLIKLSEDFANQNSGRKLSKGDVVTVHTGEVGVSAVIDDELDGCLGFATLNTRPNKKIIDAQFLCWYFNSSRFIAHCISLSTGDGRQNLNLKDFSKVMIPVPSLLEQKKIASALSLAAQEMETLQKRLDCLKQEKKALMQQLLTGKKRVKVAA